MLRTLCATLQPRGGSTVTALSISLETVQRPSLLRFRSIPPVDHLTQRRLLAAGEEDMLDRVEAPLIRQYVVDGVLFCRRSSGGLFTAEKIADPVFVARYGERTPANARSQLGAAVVRRNGDHLLRSRARTHNSEQTGATLLARL